MDGRKLQMDLVWIKQSRFYFRIAIGASLVALYLYTTVIPDSDYDLPRAADALEKHANWNGRPYLRAVAAHPITVVLEDNLRDAAQEVLLSCSPSGRMTGRCTVHADSSNLFFAKSSFDGSGSLKEYVEALEQTASSYPRVPQVGNQGIRETVRSICRSTETTLHIRDCSVHPIDDDNALYRLEIRVPIRSDAEKLLLDLENVDMPGLRFRRQGGAVLAEKELPCVYTSVPLSIDSWQAAKQLPDVPVTDLGYVDTRILRDILPLVGEMSPAGALRYTRLEANSNVTTYSLLSLTMRFPEQSWLVGVVVIGAQFMALLAVWFVGKNRRESDGFDSLAWAPVRGEFVFGVLFTSELALPVAVLFAIGVRHGPAYLYGFAGASFVLSLMYFIRLRRLSLCYWFWRLSDEGAKYD